MPLPAARARCPLTSVSAWLLAAAALGLCACGVEVKYTPVAGASHAMAPRPASAVEVLMSRPKGRRFVEVGRLEARQESSVAGGDSLELLNALREEAGRRGCEGILVLGPDDKVVGAGSGTGVGVATLKGYKATCVVFK